MVILKPLHKIIVSFSAPTHKPPGRPLSRQRGLLLGFFSWFFFGPKKKKFSARADDWDHHRKKAHSEDRGHFFVFYQSLGVYFFFSIHPLTFERNMGNSISAERVEKQLNKESPTEYPTFTTKEEAANLEAKFSSELLANSIDSIQTGMELMKGEKNTNNGDYERIVRDIERDVGRFLIETKWLKELVFNETIDPMNLSNAIKGHENHRRFVPLFCELYANVLAWMDELSVIIKKAVIKMSILGVVIFLCGVALLATIVCPVLGWIASTAVLLALAVLGFVCGTAIGAAVVKMNKAKALFERAKQLLDILDRVRGFQEKPICRSMDKQDFEKNVKKSKGQERYNKFLEKFQDDHNITYQKRDMRSLYESLGELYKFCEKAI